MIGEDLDLIAFTKAQCLQLAISPSVSAKSDANVCCAAAPPKELALGRLACADLSASSNLAIHAKTSGCVDDEISSSCSAPGRGP